jgi:hypothetical protein
MPINSYSIGDYWWNYFINDYWWVLVVIALMDIGGYFINGYWCLFY